MRRKEEQQCNLENSGVCRLGPARFNEHVGSLDSALRAPAFFEAHGGCLLHGFSQNPPACLPFHYFVQGFAKKKLLCASKKGNVFWLLGDKQGDWINQLGCTLPIPVLRSARGERHESNQMHQSDQSMEDVERRDLPKQTAEAKEGGSQSQTRAR
jgi:hypothetical protein